MSRAGIIKAVGRDWVVGLTWRSFAEHPSLRERREDARALRAGWIVLRDTFDLVQAGFGSIVVDRQPKKLYSLAAAVAAEHQQPWCGIFKLSEKLWWYIAVRDGQAILPDGDIAGDYATVLEARQRHEIYGDWTSYEGTLQDLIPLLEFAKKNSKLKPLKSVEPPPFWRVMVPVFLVVIVAACAFLLYQRHERQVRIAEQKRLEALMLARQKLALPPLLTMPSPNEWLTACSSVMQSLNISENGWLAVDATCVGNEATIVWQRLMTATVAARPAGELSSDGNKDIQAFSLGSLPHGSGQMLDYEAEDEALYNVLQPIDVQAAIGGPSRDPGALYVSQSVDFTLPVPPFNIDFNSVPGLRLTSLEWTQGGWVVKGVLYGK